MLEYFTYKKAKKHQEKTPKSEQPVLSPEDEDFLHRITSQVEGTPPPLPERTQDLAVAGESKGNDAQLVLSEQARNIPLPDVPDTPEGVMPGIEGEDATDSGKGKGKAKEKKNRWSFLRRDSKKGTADGLQSAADRLKEGRPKSPGAKKEEEEITVVLDKLNLAAVDNQAFSLSKESQELLKKFTLVFKDLINGVPTAYDDLESLLTNSDHQLQGLHDKLPGFLKTLIEKLPEGLGEKLGASIGPEMLAAAAEKPGLLGKGAGVASKAQKAAGVKVKVPSLKELVTSQGALIGLLRSIVSFLRLRFPAFLGVNVLWSLALFILLFILWYCHKRGREVRLEKERALTEAEMEKLKEKVASEPAGTYDGATTTAPEGASIEEVHAGIVRVQASSSGTAPAAASGSAQYAEGGSLAKE